MDRDERFGSIRCPDCAVDVLYKKGTPPEDALASHRDRCVARVKFNRCPRCGYEGGTVWEKKDAD